MVNLLPLYYYDATVTPEINFCFFCRISETVLKFTLFLSPGYSVPTRSVADTLKNSVLKSVCNCLIKYQ